MLVAATLGAVFSAAVSYPIYRHRQIRLRRKLQALRKLNKLLLRAAMEEGIAQFSRDPATGQLRLKIQRTHEPVEACGAL